MPIKFDFDNTDGTVGLFIGDDKASLNLQAGFISNQGILGVGAEAMVNGAGFGIGGGVLGEAKIPTVGVPGVGITGGFFTPDPTSGKPVYNSSDLSSLLFDALPAGGGEGKVSDIWATTEIPLRTKYGNDYLVTWNGDRLYPDGTIVRRPEGSQWDFSRPQVGLPRQRSPSEELWNSEEQRLRNTYGEGAYDLTEDGARRYPDGTIVSPDGRMGRETESPNRNPIPVPEPQNSNGLPPATPPNPGGGTGETGEDDETGEELDPEPIGPIEIAIVLRSI